MTAMVLAVTGGFQVRTLPRMTLGHGGSPKALHAMRSFLFSQNWKMIPLEHYLGVI